jgi:hypothetical protein
MCDPEARAYIHAKELKVKSWLDTGGVAYISHDYMIEGGTCIRKRPDFRFDAGTHWVCLEVDEHQHQGYPKECETVRMINIANAEGGMPGIFVRYNPDPYKDAEGKRKDPTENTRRKELLECMKHVLAHPPKAFCEVIYMYYNGYGTTGHWAREAPRVLVDFDGQST